MRARISWLLGATLLFVAPAATAQSFPCASVAPEVREQMREAGACRDAAFGDAPTAAVPASLPREFSSTRRDARKRAPTATTTADQPAAQTKVTPPPEPDVSADPAPASSANPQVSDESLVDVAGTTPATAPVLAPAAADSALTPPAPAPAVAPAVPVAERSASPASRRFPIAFSANAALILGAGVLLGLLFGALLMRQWLLRRAQAAEERAAWMPPLQDQQPVETSATGVPETGAVPEIGLAEIRFAARLELGETTIVLASRPDSEDVAIEHASVHHA